MKTSHVSPLLRCEPVFIDLDSAVYSIENSSCVLGSQLNMYANLESKTYWLEDYRIVLADDKIAVDQSIGIFEIQYNCILFMGTYPTLFRFSTLWVYERFMLWLFSPLSEMTYYSSVFCPHGLKYVRRDSYTRISQISGKGFVAFSMPRSRCRELFVINEWYNSEADQSYIMISDIAEEESSLLSSLFSVSRTNQNTGI